MAVTASGSLSEPLDKLRSLLAASTAFQTRMGAADATAALEKIWGGFSAVDDHDAKRPYAIIGTHSDWAASKIAGGGRNVLVVEGAMVLYLTDFSRFPGAQWDDFIDFNNFAGDVLDYLIDQSGQSDNLSITAIRVDAPTWGTDPRETAERDGTIWRVAFAITHGI